MSRGILLVLCAIAGLGRGQMQAQGQGPLGQQSGFGAGMPSDGQECKVDTKCYQFSAGCTLADGFPFERISPVSCDECLNQCQQRVKAAFPYACRSVVYDGPYQACDLFAVVAQSPQRLTKFPGRIYLQPTGADGCASNNTGPTPEEPGAAVCGEGQTAKVVLVKDTSADGVTGKDAPGLDEAGCAKACIAGKLPDGTAVACKSALFKGGTCTLATADPVKPDGYKKEPGTTYMKLLCFKSDLVKGCPDTFTENPQKILVGQNTQTIDAATYEECTEACLDSQAKYQFVCKSGMFFYQDTKVNCILNKESATTMPDVFTDAAEGDLVTYFELGCGGGRRFHDVPAKKRKAFKDALRDLPEAGSWARWSTCHGRDSEQFRLRRCRELDPRDCPRQTRSCDPMVKSKSTMSEGVKKSSSGLLIDETNNLRAKDAVNRGECKAAHINGKKECRLGYRVVGTRKELCTHPVDC